MVHTLPDNATLFSAVLDEVSLCEKKCSVAGFDTVIIVSSSEEKAQELEQYFQQFIQPTPLSKVTHKGSEPEVVLTSGSLTYKIITL